MHRLTGKELRYGSIERDVHGRWMLLTVYVKLVERETLAVDFGRDSFPVTFRSRWVSPGSRRLAVVSPALYWVFFD